MRKWIRWAGVAVVAVGAAAFAWLFWFAGGSGEPSTALTTPELSPTTTVGTTNPTDANSTETTGVSSGDSVTFEIDQTSSTASFELGELLRGQPNQVIGTTDQVVGQFRVDLDDLSTVEFSDIVINARTFATDSSTRDRQIRGPIILNSASDEHELITFAVTSVDGLSGQVSTGDSFQFNVTGDLTIKGITHSVTFDVDATLSDGSTVEGSAMTEVLREDFGIGIPGVSSVAEVTDEVTIRLDFVAKSG